MTPASTARFDRDSAFSDLVYLPGSSVATVRVAEWQGSGLTVLQTNDLVKPQVLDEADFQALSGLLHQAQARRGEVAGTWYFHVRDLTTWRLDPVDGESGGGDLLRAWLDEVDARWGPDGTSTIQWSLPSAARAAARDGEQAGEQEPG